MIPYPPRYPNPARRQNSACAASMAAPRATAPSMAAAHAAAAQQQPPRRLKVLAIFCNPKGTDALRLQSEQRVLQQSLRSADLEVAPAATVDDVRSALLGKRFDVIHFSGHGCVDGPLQDCSRSILPQHLRRQAPPQASGIAPCPCPGE